MLTHAFLLNRLDELKQSVESSLPSEKKNQSFEQLEHLCEESKHVTCSRCNCTGLSVRVGNLGRCNLCSSFTNTVLKNCNFLPTWTDSSGQVHNNVPPQLDNLTIAEKMMIQLVSPFVPLKHIKNGVFGMTGHVCAFEQRVQDAATVLPNLPSDVNFIKVAKSISSEIGSEESQTKSFRVNKTRVIDALVWLKRHNPLYQHVTIDASRLEDIDNNEEVCK